MKSKSASGQLADSLVGALTPTLRPIGFSWKSKGSSFYRSTPTGWVSLHLGIRKSGGGLTVWPTVAVRFDRLQQLLMERVPEIGEAKKLESASIGTCLATLAGGSTWTRWVIAFPHDVKPAADEMLQIFLSAGLPTLERYSNPEAALGLLSRNDKEAQSWMPLDHVRCMNAVGLSFVLGPTDRVETLIQRGNEYLRARNNESRSFFEEFAREIETRMKGRAGG